MKGRIIILCALFALTASCTDDTEDFGSDKARFLNDDRGEIVTRCTELDKFTTLHNMQSDQMAMIVDRIAFTDSVYSLNLSLEESRLIGIPDSIYEKGISIVSSLNKK